MSATAVRHFKVRSTSLALYKKVYGDDTCHSGSPLGDDSIWLSPIFGDDLTGFWRSVCFTTAPPPARKHVQVTVHSVSLRWLAARHQKFCLSIRTSPSQLVLHIVSKVSIYRNSLSNRISNRKMFDFFDIMENDSESDVQAYRLHTTHHAHTRTHSTKHTAPRHDTTHSIQRTLAYT